MACSDLHYKNDPACREKQRFEEGLRQLYAYADSQPYKAVDAVYIAGDFTDQGTMEQMTLVKESLDRGLRPGTEAVLCMASHEYGGPGGQAGARERFGQIFGQDADTHRVIRGFHFIAVSTDEDCRFWEPQVTFAAKALEAVGAVIAAVAVVVDRSTGAHCGPKADRSAGPDGDSGPDEGARAD